MVFGKISSVSWLFIWKDVFKLSLPGHYGWQFGLSTLGETQWTRKLTNLKDFSLWLRIPLFLSRSGSELEQEAKNYSGIFWRSSSSPISNLVHPNPFILKSFWKSLVSSEVKAFCIGLMRNWSAKFPFTAPLLSLFGFFLLHFLYSLGSPTTISGSHVGIGSRPFSKKGQMPCRSVPLAIAWFASGECNQWIF